MKIIIEKSCSLFISKGSMSNNGCVPFSIEEMHQIFLQKNYFSFPAYNSLIKIDLVLTFTHDAQEAMIEAVRHFFS